MGFVGPTLGEIRNGGAAHAWNVQRYEPSRFFGAVSLKPESEARLSA
jgi:hypothetical protein